MKKIKIILIEDNRLQRDAIGAMLSEQDDFKVVAALSDTQNIFEKVKELSPDIIILDLGLTQLNSLELVKTFYNDYPQIKVIVMDFVSMKEDVLKFIEAGAWGFILKDATIIEFLKTIRSVNEGVKVLPPTLAGSLFSQIVDYGVKSLGPEKFIESVRMTNREKEVVNSICEGLSNKEIAHQLNLSIYTVKSHTS